MKRLAIIICAVITSISAVHAHHLSIPEDERIDYFVERFLKSMKQDIVIYFKRAERYKPIVVDILKRYNLPEELFLLPIIESGYTAHAISRSRAVGYWQFLRKTAKIYGLRIDRFVDERRDIEKSTKAAARYLRHLYKQFRSWELVLAAYNAGDGRIKRIIKRTSIRNFWYLSSLGFLTKQTVNFVPKFFAICKLYLNKERYGINVPPVKPLTYEKLYVKGSVDMRWIARFSDIPYSTLKKLNSAILRDKTPPYRYELKVPTGKKYAALRAIEGFFAYKRAKQLGIKYASYWRSHVVKKGESLYVIAKRYKTSVDLIKIVNRLSSNLIRPGMILLVPKEKLKKRIVMVHPKKRHVIYEVKKGDTVWKIARIFGVTMRKVIKVNKISGRLHPGQKIKIVFGEI